ITKYRNGKEVPVREVGIRPGEKIDEVLVNEYEIRRAVETDQYFTILPEYCGVVLDVGYEVGYEYTSANTRRVTGATEIGALLDRMGQVEFFT
ncbi:MAG: polysaccharide biosynthesis protein, partial [Gemmatimonadaceae bacterium]